jgi:pimeloyl-ACP methyl ester carboxylesterase
MRVLLRRVTAITIAVLASGCVYFKTASTPVPSEYFNYDESNSTLVLLLPGLGESPSNFVKHGAVHQIIACQPKANIIGIDSHFAYYHNASIVTRLREDIIVPARQAGVRKIWLLGISLGGMASLLYWQQYPDEIAAVIVMAPYLGEWDELELYLNDRNRFLESSNKDFLDLWDGLTNPPVSVPEITLAYGETDKFNQQQRWLAGLLDRDKVITTAGGHRWTVWQTLWPEALRRSGLCDS